MTSNYEKIRTDNILEYGRGTRHLSFLGRLYTDRTHFVFELLQNAEDAGASKLLFQLFENRLEAIHDGRFFNEKDVRGICGVGEGTKAEDITQIGKFGIGFKSVYAYTSTPEVHSGDESFRIENYIRPYTVAPRRIDGSWTTLFVFPFNAEDVSPEIACKEISGRLYNLSARTLLFLRKIKEIEYTLPDGTGGVYLRDETIRGPAKQITVIGQNNGKTEDENWLIFERYVKVPNPCEGRPESVPVEVGFRLENNEKIQKENVVRIKDSPLVVSFPTEKESRFGFLIQGPYKTTPSRDNIPKADDWNITLVQETASLLTDVLLLLKDMSLLTVSLLEALPIRTDDFSEDNMFYPVVVAIRKTLLTKALLPADDGTYISARNAKLASAEWLRKLLRTEQLELLFKTQLPLKWVTAQITERAKYDLWKYIREELKVEEVTPDSFARKVDSPFFERQTDQWFIDFYGQLTGQKALWKKSLHYWDSEGPLRAKPFVRLQNGTHVRPFQENGSAANAYLPGSANNDTSLPTVKKVFAENEEARSFLVELGIPDFDIVAEVIEHVIPKYYSLSPRSSGEHMHDIERILQAYKTDSKEKRARLQQALQETPFVLAMSSDPNSMIYRKPNVMYFSHEALEIYFSGNPDVGFISSSYNQSVYGMLQNVGVSENIRVWKKSRDHRGFIGIYDSHGWHSRGLNGFDPDIKVEGLQYALTSPSTEKSQYIWQHIAIPNVECIRGTIETSTRQTYDDSEKKESMSEFGRLLMNSRWLPGPGGEFCEPADLCLKDLPETFERNDRLADALKMKKDYVAKLIEEAGLKPETLELARKLEQDPDLLEYIQKQFSEKREKPEFPTRTVTNPERRQEKTREQVADALGKEYEERKRSVRTTRVSVDPSVWLKEQYTNNADQMVCQICKKEMPFRKRDGEYYFEAVEALSKDYFSKELEAQFLALCPLCAAMYKEFVKHDEEEMIKLKDSFINSDDIEIPLRFGEQDMSIRFVETHYHDIKAILNVQV